MVEHFAQRFFTNSGLLHTGAAIRHNLVGDVGKPDRGMTVREIGIWFCRITPALCVPCPSNRCSIWHLAHPPRPRGTRKAWVRLLMLSRRKMAVRGDLTVASGTPSSQAISLLD
jgi:hypothetical protein